MKAKKTVKTLARYLAIGLSVALAAGCAARRGAVPEKEGKTLALLQDRDELLEHVQAAAFHQDSTELRLTLSLGGRSVGGVMRMVHGQRIWLNISVLGITFARGMFTPDSLMYYEKMGKTAFEGRWEDLNRLSEVLSALDYTTLENLLCARPAFALTAEDIVLPVREGRYAFSRRDASGSVVLTGQADGHAYGLLWQQLGTPDGKAALRAEYLYDTQAQGLPQAVLFFLAGQDGRSLKVEYASDERRMQAQFPFKIPQGYRDARELLRALGIAI